MPRRDSAVIAAEAENALAAAARDLDLAARSGASVLVTARDARDRSACARAIHDCGDGRHHAFVAISGDLSGACTSDMDRWMDRAAGGTLFIDDIGALSQHVQERLLFLMVEQLRYAAEAAPFTPDDRVRLIAGSNRPLQADIAVGAFNAALFYRLNVIHIDLLQPKPGEQAMKAREILSAPAHTCDPDTDLATVARIMWDHDCGLVVVVEESGAVVGVVTDRDICIATSTRRLLPEQISAAQVMTSPVRACLSDDNVKDVLATMKQFQIRRVPVIDAGGRLLGVISMNDIVRVSHERREPSASEVVTTLAAVCAHRQTSAVA